MNEIFPLNFSFAGQVKQIKECRKQEYIFFPVKNKQNLSGAQKTKTREKLEPSLTVTHHHH
jgi:hypothetical protein